MITENSVPVHISSVEITELSDGCIIQQDDKVHLLNFSGMEVFKLCDGIRPISEIVKIFKNRHSNEDIIKFIEDYINELLDAGLIKIYNE